MPNTQMEETREEYMRWAKQRAYELLAVGEVKQAFNSLASDLNKHPSTRNHPGLNLAISLMTAGGLKTPEEMHKFISGFN
jgi:hypothetical protein